jgi:hypothetical protein
MMLFYSKEKYSILKSCLHQQMIILDAIHSYSNLGFTVMSTLINQTPGDENQNDKILKKITLH